MKPIVLATQSRYKIALFQRLGLAFDTAAPPFEEFLDSALEPAELAQRLAEGKALSLGPLFPGHTIIGADQVLALDEEIFTKPETTARAVVQLLKLSGREHYLHTAFALFDPESGARVRRVVTSSITFHPNLNAAFLKGLVEEDQSQDCVGGYKFESRGILLMSSVTTPDPNAIVGLPLLALQEALARWGYLEQRFEKP